MYKIIVRGVVQGVGFRPYIYRKAKEQNLLGYVKNIGYGVEIVVDDSSFLKTLTDLPPLSKITDFSVEQIEDIKTDDFHILESVSSSGETILPPDIFMCDDCLKELRDPSNRRHNYYFVTCTNCGPRFSMIVDYPYDRPFTSMHSFTMCDECKAEYTDPMNRRYHAQTISCKNCGPKLLSKENNKIISSDNDLSAIKKAAKLLQDGEVLSIKGVGGFHLCSIPGSVSKVRSLLHRPNKPFALMVKDIQKANQLVQISDIEKSNLESPSRPIVVLKKVDRSSYSEVSELDSLGIMLPYTSLHYMLFDNIDSPLVMTSCNIPGEPVSITETIATYFLTHEREIINRCDDSVIKVISDNPFFLRRSRGFTPLTVKLPLGVKTTLAFGSEMNNVICVGKGEEAFLSQYIGMTDQLETFDFFKDTVEKFLRLTRSKPDIIACDLHPHYNSTQYAFELKKRFDSNLIQIQHHKAHIASVAAEHNLKDYIGIAMDGLGYGEDGNIWGGEVFKVSNHSDFVRVGSLEEQSQLGGDSAAIYPKKMLLGVLSKFCNNNELRRLNLFNESDLNLYLKQLDQGFNTPLTTSAGRVLDSVSALLGLCDLRTYNGRPAMVLESIATTPLALKPVIRSYNGRKILSTSGLFRFLLDNIDKDKGNLAATSQNYLAEGLFEIARSVSSDLPIVFSGGVAYNKMISSYMINHGVLVNKHVPCGDGGISYGQVFLANNYSN